jgi:hypothetical protein
MAYCKKCGLKVKWIRDNDRWVCQNPDNSDHWDLCSKTVFEDVKKNGIQFKREVKKETHHGYKSDKYGEKLFMIEGRIIIGKGYKPSIHDKTCLPWNECSCNEENLIEILPEGACEHMKSI